MTPHQVTPRARRIALATSTLIKTLAITLRYEDQQATEQVAKLKDQPLIFCTWHNRLALSLSLYRRLFARPYPSRRMAALVSASNDGAMLAEIMKQFSVRPVRGSSSKRGAAALKELVACSREGYDIAITPDGPRGPRYQLQDGVLAAAQLTGRPILPIGYSLSAKVTTKSWDRFQVPLPLTQCRVITAAPLTVPRKLDDTTRRHLKKTLQERMDSITID